MLWARFRFEQTNGVKMKTLLIALLTTISTQAFANFGEQVLYCAPSKGKPNGLNVQQAILNISTEHPEAYLELKFNGSKDRLSMGMDYEGSDELFEMVSADSRKPYYLNTSAKKGHWPLTLKHESIDTFSQLKCAELDSGHYTLTDVQLAQVIDDECFTSALSKGASAVFEEAADNGVDYPEEITFKSLTTVKKGTLYQVIAEGNTDFVVNVKTEMKHGRCQAVQD